MATLDWQLTRAEDATLVELFVTSDADVRVEIESNLRPVWPPRRENQPADGWVESGFEGTVAAGEPLVLGYASPDDPVEPPATIAGTEPVSEVQEEPPTPEGLVRALGDARPPRDAVPTPGDSPPDDGQPGGTVTDADRPTQTGDEPSTWDRPQGDDGLSAHDRSTDDTGADRSTVEPGQAVDAWLAAVGSRIETAERLAAVETAEEARAAVSAAGGIEQVRTLCKQLDTDRSRMERTETRRAALDRRLADVEVPLSALERLA